MSRPFAVPAHAREQWDTMHARIVATGPTPCAGPDRNDWIGTSAQQDRAADACMDCPVLEQCLAYAVKAGEAQGVWGGMRPKERADRTA